MKRWLAGTGDIDIRGTIAMSSATASALAENLRNLDQMESSCGKDISIRGLNASRYRSISARFFAYANGDESPQMKEIDLIEAKNFALSADMEEAFVASRIKRLANIADLRGRMLVLLKQIKRPEVLTV